MSSQDKILVQIILYELYALELQVAYSEVVSCKYPMAYKGNLNLTNGGGGGGGGGGVFGYTSRFLLPDSF